MSVSVTITTLNRAESLRATLEALAAQDFPRANFEVIVADNGSRDHTRAVADSFAPRFDNLRYLYDARPGQLVGWHRGLATGQGEISSFIDDDARPAPTWLAALDECFHEQNVGLVTGPITLAFDGPTPDWLDAMTLGEPGGQTLPLLGMLDCGPKVREIPGNFVWGTNFTVRRTVLREVGGFHPCAMPWWLIRFYGDGEIHVGRSAAARGHRVLYHPRAAVTHAISTSRLSFENVARKFTSSGCARAYQTLRSTGATFPTPSPDEIAAIVARYVRDGATVPAELQTAMAQGLDNGIAMVRRAFETDPPFRDWVLRPDYLDLDAAYVHPDLIASDDTRDWRSGT